MVHRHRRHTRMRRAERATIGIVMSAVLVLSSGVGCGGSSPGDVTVFAASSLTEGFEQISRVYDRSNDADVALDFDGSARLATQIAQGAPADVFASADRRTMDDVVESVGARRGPEVFALNELTIVVERGNPTGITGLADLARGDLRVALADPAVPAGAYAADVLDRAGVVVDPATLEGNVRGVVTKVSLGEADAGIVYVTDVAATDDALETVAIPRADNVTAEYLIAVLEDAPDGADEFADLVLGPEGRAILRAQGFGLP